MTDTARHSLDQIEREAAKLKADVARVIDGEAWKAMDDGRDALEGSLWHLRRDWALEKASQIIAIVSRNGK